MIVARYSLIILVAFGMSAHAVIAGEDNWKAERKAPESEQPAICTSMAALIHNQIDKARAIKLALKNSESGPPSSMLEAAQRLMGNKYESEWQREQTRLLEKARVDALGLNARYSDQRCGSIDVDQEIAREAPQQGYVPLKSSKKQERF